MPSTLKNLQVHEVSLVPKAANMRKFLIYKSDDGEGGGELMSVELILKTLETPLENEVEVDKIFKTILSVDAMDAMKGTLKLINAFKSEFPVDIFEKIAGLTGLTIPVPEPVIKAGMAKACGNVKKQKSDMCGMGMQRGLGGSGEMEEMEMKKMPIKKADGTLDLDGVPEEMKPMVENLWKAHEEAIAKNAEFEEAIAKAADEKSSLEFIQKAQGYKNLVIKAEDLGPILKAVSEKTPEHFEKISQILKAADTALEKAGIFAELGSSQGGNTDSDAWSRIEKAAESVIKNDSTITKASAIDRVMRENPSLYSDYIKERGGK